MSALFLPFRGLIDLIYPPRCLVCGETPPGRESFCARCSSGLFHDPHLCCPRCAARVGPFSVGDDGCAACRANSVPFETTVRLGPYDGPLRDAVLLLKSSRNEGLAEVLGERLGAIHRERLTALALDAIVPVPMYWSRRLMRGYNQSSAIAFGIASVLKKPRRTGWLRQVKRTKPQKTLGATQRKENVSGAFAVRSGLRLDGLRLLLVDDVMTTGATACEAARALRRVGARVEVAVLARAEG